MPGWGHDHVATGVSFLACQKHIMAQREECNCIDLKLGYTQVRKEKNKTYGLQQTAWNNSWFTKENCEVRLKKKNEEMPLSVLQLLDTAIKFCL